MQASIYSNGSQECERASSLMKAVHLDEVVVYELDKHFTAKQFEDEFGDDTYEEVTLETKVKTFHKLIFFSAVKAALEMHMSLHDSINISF